MNIRLIFTIAASKLLIKVCRLAKLGGTTLPGKLARKLYPDILKVIAKDFKTIMVTGTNGKTTTTRIIGQILKENNIDYITNKSGANLVAGIITTFINAVNLHGKCAASTALIEIDEAAFNVISDYLEPDILVVTNFFRDQLDRYGELYNTLRGVQSGIQKTGKTKLVLNADDSLCASLGRTSDREVIYYGLLSCACDYTEEVTNTDAMYCLYCKTRYDYSYHVYGHLGGFRCPNCGYEQPMPTVACIKIQELASTYSDIRFNISGSDVNYEARINLPGLYNVYNALAAAACGHMLGLPVANTIKAMGTFECGFGRMETIKTEGKNIKIILVKNPTGFNQVLSFLQTEENSMQIAFLINDKLADGTDISWLWDVDFEKLQNIQDKLDNIYTSGIRAEDMAVRLKYAGVSTDKISIIKDYKELINTGLGRTPEGGSFYILPSYTALLEMRSILRKKFKLEEFWK
jgi:UDP-N-acetylmuramyl tripeptide synthase